MTKQQAIDFFKSQIAKFSEQLEQGIHIKHNEMCIKYAQMHIEVMEGKRERFV